MQLYIDYREKALLERISVTPKNLILGDIVIEKDGKEIVILERKTISDLASSICDGRYQEQSFRLLEYDIPNHNIVYIIEGSLNQIQSISKKTLLSSLLSLWYKKGFSIFRTESVDETVEYIHAIFEKVQKEDGASHIPKEYASSIKKQKKDKLTPETIDIIMLSQIPTISTVTAKALLSIYKNVFQLTSSLKENNNCLDTFTYGDKNRKLSKKSIENLKLFLHV